MQKLLANLEGVICHINDILVHGSTQEQLNVRLRKVLERIKAAGVTLNKQKSEFCRNTVKFFDHIITRESE